MLRALFRTAPELKSPREIGLMREAGKVVAEALRRCRSMAQPGVKTVGLLSVNELLLLAAPARNSTCGSWSPRLKTAAIVPAHPY